MIKATDLIKKKTVKRDTFYIKSIKGFELGNNHHSLKDTCQDISRSLYEKKYKESLNTANAATVLEKILDEREDKIAKLAARFEREFIRANKEPKFIILHGLDIKEMEILTWNTGCDVPYYENAVFASKEEAKRFAELEEMEDFTIVEVLNEN